MTELTHACRAQMHLVSKEIRMAGHTMTTMTPSAIDGTLALDEAATPRKVAITGATGYLGRVVTCKLLARGHDVTALVRPGTRHRVAAGAHVRELDLFNAVELAAALKGRDAVLHLVGTAHPNPSKAREFVSVDLASARACARAAANAGVGHFVYVSVAQPAPVMKAYVAARAEAERALARNHLTATVVRPWYVLGPGHRWPILLSPIYALARLIPLLEDGARRLGLVTLEQMTNTLVHAIEQPPGAGSRRIVEVPEILAKKHTRP
jgi:uncharacterized protein YbjT (DUF2867 family)